MNRELWSMTKGNAELVRGLARQSNRTEDEQLAHMVRDWALMSARYQGITLAKLRAIGRSDAPSLKVVGSPIG